MKPLRAIAPGKIVICGEYAVLAGAPAVSMAVDCYAAVDLAASNDRYCRVTTIGYEAGTYRFTLSSSGRINWHDRPGVRGLGLLEAALLTLDVETTRAFSCTIDTSTFSDAESKRKYGLGSSAAAMTALVAALCAANDDDDAVNANAFAAHNRFQDNRGSGVDIATSTHGGVIEYSKHASAEISHRAWPGQMFYRILWSGRPASTVARLEKLNLQAQSVQDWGPLTDAARRAAAAWSSGDAGHVLAAIRDYAKYLEQFDARFNLGIFTAGHGELMHAANNDSVIYKPCGAGGGDVGIALSTDVDRLNDFVGFAADSGFRPLRFSLTPNGVRVSAGVTQ